MESQGSTDSEERETGSGGRVRANSFSKSPVIPIPLALLSEEKVTSDSAGEKGSESKEIRKDLNERELKALRKGLDEATHHRDKDSIREEEEEKRAADAEKKIRNAAILPSKIGIEPPMRKFKILMLGDSGVGKSSLINRWTSDTFSATLVGTVGVDFKAKKVQVGSEYINVQVWDTAGQEQFHKITTSYYGGANGIMLVYDISDKSSYNNVEYWIKNIKQHASEFVHVALIGNKIDLRKPDDKSITFETGQALAAKHNVPYFETSAKDATNVESAFFTIVTNIVESDKKRDKISPKRGSTKTIAEKAEMHNKASLKPDEKCNIQ